jgi:hypothetical protein
MIVYGRRAYGRVGVSGETFVLTEFVHLWFLPLFPTGSHLVLSRDATGLCQNLPIPLSGVSVLAAYLRCWGVAALFASLVSVVASLDDGAEATVPRVAAAALSLAVVVFAFKGLGRLSPDELERRRAYARFAGIPVDVALLGAQADAIAASLRSSVPLQARGLMSGSYRSSRDPATQWAEIALDPTVVDRAFLEGCLTLTRIEWSRAKGAERVELAKRHEELWERIATMETAASSP